MKKKLGFMTDHRFIIGVQIVLSIILMISIIFVKVLPIRYLIVIGPFLAVLALLVYLVAKPGPIVSRKVQKRETGFVKGKRRFKQRMGSSDAFKVHI